MGEHIVWKPAPKEVNELTEKMFGPNSRYRDRVVSEPYGVYAGPSMQSVAKEIYNMEVRSDDIWIVTFPKCGTTLTQVKITFSQFKSQPCCLNRPNQIGQPKLYSTF